MLQLLVLLAMALCVSLIVNHGLRKAALNHPVNPESSATGKRQVVLKYAPTLKLAAAVFPLAIFIILIVAITEGASAAKPAMFDGITLLLVLTPLVLLMLIEVLGKRVILNDEHVQVCSVWGEYWVRWSEIKSVSYNRWTKMFVIHTKAGRHLGINPSLSGLVYFELLLWEKVDEERFDQALWGFRLNRQGFI